MPADPNTHAYMPTLCDRICVGTFRDSIVLRMITSHYLNLSRYCGHIANELFNRYNDRLKRESRCIWTYKRNVLFRSVLYKFALNAPPNAMKEAAFALSEEQSYLVSLQIAWSTTSLSVKVRNRLAQVRNAGGYHRVTANTLISIPCKEGIMRVPQFSEPSGLYIYIYIYHLVPSYF